MVTYQANDDEGHGAGGRGDHGWASAEEGEEDGEPEGGIKSHHGADADDDAKADDFRDDGEGGDEAGEDVTTDVAKPLLFSCSRFINVNSFYNQTCNKSLF